MNKYLTNHTTFHSSYIRGSQRGLKQSDQEILFDLGKSGFKIKSYQSGSIHWYFGKKQIIAAANQGYLQRNISDRLIGVELVVDLDEKIIITFNKEKRGPRQIRKNLRARRNYKLN